MADLRRHVTLIFTTDVACPHMTTVLEARLSQGFHSVFEQEVSGVFQQGIFHFSYERK